MTFWVLMFWQRFQHTAARRRLPEFKASFIGGLEFQHTAARRRLPNIPVAPARFELFQHTAARRRLHVECGACFVAHVVSTHSRPKAAARKAPRCVGLLQVSTHSRPKAAAAAFWLRGVCFVCFNTQPPEGGCPAASMPLQNVGVSTHSRPKAAARRPMARPE